MTMNMDNLFYESFRESLKHCVRVCGGYEALGLAMWPAMSASDAGQKLRDSLNENHRAKLDIEEIVFICAQARQKGCYDGTHQFNLETGFGKPQAVEPEDQKAELQREFIQAVKLQERLSKQMQSFNLAGVSK